MAYDAEISAIQITVSQLQCQSESFSRAVMSSDSKTALLAISTYEAPMSADILNCYLALRDLIKNYKEITLQWLPTHCDFLGK